MLSKLDFLITNLFEEMNLELLHVRELVLIGIEVLQILATLSKWLLKK